MNATSGNNNSADAPPRLAVAMGTIALLSAFAIAQHDDTRARERTYQQDQQARHGHSPAHRREAAARQACGLHAQAQWLDDKTMQCLRIADDAGDATTTTMAAGGRQP